ncbi:GNAT family N-acetyltransferase [Aliikangiella coralliicola]|uniref:tRNA(Met) cytidine acetyltransferase n=1 Tax=Aliikangiella coralliicola TaxID=2592383 RepID=A0A545U4T6_9GAMM|nr:GNAT family N-acetyltransferase [Aliikangiella coralliicola]TQV84487.1 tRNA(Met) cytidine acetyltransferase [Aliikangiella coralliicola]
MAESQNQLENYYQWHSRIEALNIRGVIITARESALFEQIKTGQISESPSSVFSNLAHSIKPSGTKVDHILGGEFKYVYFELTNSTFDVNLFAAITGTLVGGGLLFLVVDKTTLRYAMHLAQPNLSCGDSPVQNVSTVNSPETICPLLDRVLRYSAKKSSVAIICNDTFYTTNDKAQLTNCDGHDNALDSQATVVSQIIRVANGHSKRPLVITANRGRGKSAALGIAAAQIASEKTIEIFVTAPSKNNLPSFYKHLNQQLAENSVAYQSKGNIVSLENGSAIRFLPPDQLLKQNETPSLVMIDEAAAIPVNILNRITLQFTRLVFATTSHGYEGNGKGFEVRFKQKLLDIRPQTRFAQLSLPIRWDRNDQLEPATFNALLLNAELTQTSIGETDLKHSLLFEEISKSELRENNQDLTNIFALLVNAHYQTRPADLQQLLSNNKLRVVVLRHPGQEDSNQETQSNTIIAVALISEEGELSPEDCRLLSDGQKRIKGELLPQSIVSHFGLVEAGEKKYFRIMRIAVHPNCQQHGVGTQLLNHIKKLAKASQIDFVGASFAATNDVVKFWLKNNYQCIRFGSSKDSSSGSHSLEVLSSLNAEATEILDLLTSRFSRSFIYKLKNQLADLSDDMVSEIILSQWRYSPVELTDYELDELKKFVNSARSFEMVDDLALKLFQAKRHLITDKKLLDNRQLHFLICCLFKANDWKLLADSFTFTGKKQAQEYLRQIVLKLVQI